MTLFCRYIYPDVMLCIVIFPGGNAKYEIVDFIRKKTLEFLSTGHGSILLLQFNILS